MPSAKRALPLLLVIFNPATAPPAPQHSFDRWVIAHNITYATEGELQQRRETFAANAALIAAHNAAEDAASHGKGKGYRLGVGPFADLTNAEFKALRGSPYVPRSEREQVAPVGEAQCGSDDDDSAAALAGAGGDLYAPALDWRAQGAVTPVKQQGTCGACWSFSATGAIEGAWRIFGPNKTLVSLSEQELMDCSPKNNGCNGGNPYYAFQYVKDNHGLDTEADYPWVGKQGACDGRGAARHVATVGAACDVAREDETALVKAVTRQPVAVALEGTSVAFQHYASGVLHQEGNCGEAINHAVLFIGYGTDAGVNYWIAKNSWGERWGEAGYIRIAQGENVPAGVW